MSGLPHAQTRSTHSDQKICAPAGIEPLIHNCPARSLHPSVRVLSKLQGKQSHNLWFAFLPHFHTNVNFLTPKPFFGILDIDLVSGEVFFWLWFAVPAVNETSGRVSSWNCGVLPCQHFAWHLPPSQHASISTHVTNILFKSTTRVHQVTAFCILDCIVCLWQENYEFLRLPLLCCVISKDWMQPKHKLGHV